MNLRLTVPLLASGLILGPLGLAAAAGTVTATGTATQGSTYDSSTGADKARPD
jgi:hypothetical protein